MDLASIKNLPIFPLSGVLLLPGGRLPLNIFEPRYVQMVDRALSGDRLIGMVQPVQEGSEEVFDIGCAGRIVEFSETNNGRYLITLKGVSRFSITQEDAQRERLYRQVTPDWAPYEADLDEQACLDIDRDKLHGYLKRYFTNQELCCDWEAVADASDAHLITCLSMVCPFSAQEKQALLEAPCCRTRASLFMNMLEIAQHECSGAHHCH